MFEADQPLEYCSLHFKKSRHYFAAGCFSDLGKAEIGELEDRLFLVKVAVQKIFRLEISVDDAILVAIQYCPRHLYDTISRLVFCVVVLKVRQKQGRWPIV